MDIGKALAAIKEWEPLETTPMENLKLKSYIDTFADRLTTHLNGLAIALDTAKNTNAAPVQSEITPPSECNVLRDKLAILDNYGPNIVQCKGHRYVASGLVCPHCDSINPSEECDDPLTEEHDYFEVVLAKKP